MIRIVLNKNFEKHIDTLRRKLEEDADLRHLKYSKDYTIKLMPSHTFNDEDKGSALYYMDFTNDISNQIANKIGDIIKAYDENYFI